MHLIESLKFFSVALYLKPEWRSFDACTFPMRHNITFMHLGTLYSTLALSFGPILDSEITNKKPNSVKNVALNVFVKIHLCTVYELQEGRSWPCTILAENLHVI